MHTFHIKPDIIGMCAHVCVCVCVSGSVHACLYIYICACACVHAYMRMCMMSEFYGSYHGKILELVSEYKQR